MLFLPQVAGPSESIIRIFAEMSFASSLVSSPLRLFSFWSIMFCCHGPSESTLRLFAESTPRLYSLAFSQIWSIMFSVPRLRFIFDFALFFGSHSGFS
jgi:hypothetical protein